MLRACEERKRRRATVELASRIGGWKLKTIAQRGAGGSNGSASNMTCRSLGGRWRYGLRIKKATR